MTPYSILRPSRAISHGNGDDSPLSAISFIKDKARSEVVMRANVCCIVTGCGIARDWTIIQTGESERYPKRQEYRFRDVRAAYVTARHRRGNPPPLKVTVQHPRRTLPAPLAIFRSRGTTLGRSASIKLNDSDSSAL